MICFACYLKMSAKMKVRMTGFEKMIRERIQTANMLFSIIFAAINELSAAWRLVRKTTFAR